MTDRLTNEQVKEVLRDAEADRYYHADDVVVICTELLERRAKDAQVVTTEFHGCCPMCNRIHDKKSADAANASTDACDRLPCPVCRRGP